jgi:hypothetical protein
MWIGLIHRCTTMPEMDDKDPVGEGAGACIAAGCTAHLVSQASLSPVAHHQICITRLGCRPCLVAGQKL